MNLSAVLKRFPSSAERESVYRLYWFLSKEDEGQEDQYFAEEKTEI